MKENLKICNIKDQYKHLFPSSFIFENIIYKLKGTINQVSVNHYNYLTINNANERNNLNLHKSYIYDGMNFDNNIEEINIDINYNINDLLVYKPKIYIFRFRLINK